MQTGYLLIRALTLTCQALACYKDEQAKFAYFLDMTRTSTRVIDY